MQTIAKQKDFFKISFLAVFFSAVVFIYYPFLAPYLADKGFSGKQISLIFSFSPFVLIFISAIMGRLSDVLGRQQILNATIILEILAVIFYIFIDKNIFALIIATILLAVGDEGFNLTILQKMQDGIRGGRGVMTGIFESVRSISRLIGPLIGTFLVSIASINLILKISVVLFFLLLIANNIKRRIKLNNYNEIRFSKKDLNFLRNVKKFWQLRELRGITLQGIAVHFCLPAQYIFIPLFILEDLGGSLRDVGIFASIWGLFHLFQFVAGKLCDKRGEKKVIFYSIFMYALFLAAIYFTPSTMILFLLAALLSLFGSFWNTSAWCYMFKVGQRIKGMGLVSGSYASIVKIGSVVGYLLSGLIVSIWDTRTLFFFYGLLIFCSIIISKRYFYKFGKDYVN